MLDPAEGAEVDARSPLPASVPALRCACSRCANSPVSPCVEPVVAAVEMLDEAALEPCRRCLGQSSPRRPRCSLARTPLRLRPGSGPFQIQSATLMPGAGWLGLRRLDRDGHQLDLRDGGLRRSHAAASVVAREGLLQRGFEDAALLQPIDRRRGAAAAAARCAASRRAAPRASAPGNDSSMICLRVSAPRQPVDVVDASGVRFRGRPVLDQVRHVERSGVVLPEHVHGSASWRRSPTSVRRSRACCR